MHSHSTSGMELFFRFGLIALVFSYGTIIVWLGLKGNSIVRYIGRVREVTYVFVMFVPVFYSAIPFSWKNILGAILFFPVYYYAIELFCRLTPNPKAIVQDNRSSNYSQATAQRPQAPSYQHPAYQAYQMPAQSFQSPPMPTNPQQSFAAQFPKR